MSTSDNEEPSYPIESVNSALTLLTLLRDRASIGVTEASKILGVAPSTAHRLFQMLRYHEFMEQDSTSRSYRAGPALVQLGLGILRRLDIRTNAGPHLAELAIDTRETVYLGVLQADAVFVLDSIESTQAVRVGTRIGLTFPAHDATSGHVLLAALPIERLKSLYSRPRIPHARSDSSTSRAKLFELLGQVRQSGYSMRIGDPSEDVASISVPILDHTGSARAAIGIAIPTFRFPEHKIPHLLGLMRRAASFVRKSLP